MKFLPLSCLLLIAITISGSDRKKRHKILSRKQYLEQQARQEEKLKTHHIIDENLRIQRQQFHEGIARARLARHKEPNCLMQYLYALGPELSKMVIGGALGVLCEYTFGSGTTGTNRTVFPSNQTKG
jgi:hypothetical protein